MHTLRFFLLSSLLLAWVAGQPARAQGHNRPRQPGARISQLDNAKIAFITSRLTLTQDRAQRFWPLYNDFVARRRELNRTARLLRRAATNLGLSDAQLRENFTQDFAPRQQQLNLEKDYFEKSQKVLTLRQLAQLYQAERDFTKEVLRRVAGADQAGGPPASDD
jgi:cation diffusion facilitator CzcD-associated flavoprotein CzcO